MRKLIISLCSVLLVATVASAGTATTKNLNTIRDLLGSSSGLNWLISKDKPANLILTNNSSDNMQIAIVIENDRHTEDTIQASYNGKIIDEAILPSSTGGLHIFCLKHDSKAVLKISRLTNHSENDIFGNVDVNFLVGDC